MSTPPTGRASARCAVLAAAVYMLLALVVLRPILPAPHRLLPYPAAHATQGAPLVRLDRTDQSMVVATTARNAERFVHAPWALRDGGQCQPMPRSYTRAQAVPARVGVVPAWAARQDRAP